MRRTHQRKNRSIKAKKPKKKPIRRIVTLGLSTFLGTAFQAAHAQAPAPANQCQIAPDFFQSAVNREPSVPYVTQSATACPGGRYPAFPGAEGFGACVTGGRGGRVIAVTNLNATGTGSLQWAIDQPGPRIVVFRVSGIIDRSIDITHGDLTIAGQTSPGGITVRGILCANYANNSPSGNCQNVIIRHLRSRPSHTDVRPVSGYLLDDGLRLDGGSDLIFDHLSIAHGDDETVQVSRVARVTIQNSTFSELINPGHYWGTGMLINYSSATHPLQDLSFHHNIWNRQEQRLPEISCEQNGDDGVSTCGGGRYLNLELANNVLFDPGFPIYYTTPPDSSTGTNLNLNWIGNSSFARNDYPYGVMNQDVATNPVNHNYFNDNRLNLRPSTPDVGLLSCCSDYYLYGGLTGAFASMFSTRNNFPGVSYHSSSQMLSYAVRYMGAFPRDPMERRLLYPVAQRQIATSATATGTLSSRMGDPCGDAFLTDIPSEAVPQDSDGDGMPDSWEVANGLNPNADDSAGTSLGASRNMAGLTNIEIYLHDEHIRKISGGAPLPVMDRSTASVPAASSPSPSVSASPSPVVTVAPSPSPSRTVIPSPSPSPSPSSSPSPRVSPSPSPTASASPRPSSTSSVTVNVTPAGMRVGQTVGIAASSTGVASPRYLFTVTDPSGRNSNPCGSSYAAANTCNFSPRSAGVHRVQVSVRASTRTSGYDAQQRVNYTVATTSYSSCPPEQTRLSTRGEPIGVTCGHVRYCWPGEANCYCDTDSDCYAMEGYLSCSQR